MQTYFFTVISGYSTGQRWDREKYNSIYSMTGLTSDPALPNRSNPWDSRVTPAPGVGYSHTRQESTTSDTGMLDNNHYGAPREAVPVPTFLSTGHLSKSNYNQYNEYEDHYHTSQRPQ
jgi:hypothetical protein